MYDSTMAQAMRIEYGQQAAEADAFGWMAPPRRSVWARITARLRRAEQRATVHQLTTQVRPQADRKAA